MICREIIDSTAIDIDIYLVPIKVILYLNNFYIYVSS